MINGCLSVHDPDIRTCADDFDVRSWVIDSEFTIDTDLH